MSAPAEKVPFGGSPFYYPEAVAVASLQPSATAAPPPTTTTRSYEMPPMKVDDAETAALSTATMEMPNTTMPVRGSVSTSLPAGTTSSAVQITPGPLYNNNGSGMTSNLPMSQQQKIGARCCGCCCDYRRAVIIVAIIFIVLTSINLIAAITAISVPGTAASVENDDAYDEIAETSAMRLIIMASIGLAMAVVALIGALRYNVPMLCLVVLWFVVSLGVGIYFEIDFVNSVNEVRRETGEPEAVVSPFFYAIDGIITALWMYPHVGLILEIRKGIMSAETYPREEYSCCCTDNATR